MDKKIEEKLNKVARNESGVATENARLSEIARVEAGLSDKKAEKQYEKAYKRAEKAENKARRLQRRAAAKTAAEAAADCGVTDDAPYENLAEYKMVDYEEDSFNSQGS